MQRSFISSCVVEDRRAVVDIVVVLRQVSFKKVKKLVLESKRPCVTMEKLCYIDMYV